MLKRVILAIELIILCGPAVAVLCIGVMYLPAFLLAAVTVDSGDWGIGALMVICGLWGLISLASLVWHTFRKRSRWPGHPIQMAGLTIGCCACIIGLVTAGERTLLLFVFMAPLIATAHLLYLNKKKGVAPQ